MGAWWHLLGERAVVPWCGWWQWTEGQIGMGKAGFRLRGSKEVTRLYPAVEKDLLVSLALRQCELFAGGSSP